MTHRVLASIACATLAVTLSSCGTKGIDTHRVEQSIKSRMTKGNPGLVVTVECPSKVALKVGGTFHCVVKANDGQQVMATVTMENDAGDLTWTAQ